MHFLPFGIVHGTNANIVLPFRRGVNRGARPEGITACSVEKTVIR